MGLEAVIWLHYNAWVTLGNPKQLIDMLNNLHSRVECECTGVPS